MPQNKDRDEFGALAQSTNGFTAMRDAIGTSDQGKLSTNALQRLINSQGVTRDVAAQKYGLSPDMMDWLESRGVNFSATGVPMRGRELNRNAGEGGGNGGGTLGGNTNGQGSVGGTHGPLVTDRMTTAQQAWQSAGITADQMHAAIQAANQGQPLDPNAPTTQFLQPYYTAAGNGAPQAFAAHQALVGLGLRASHDETRAARPQGLMDAATPRMADDSGMVQPITPAPTPPQGQAMTTTQQTGLMDAGGTNTGSQYNGDQIYSWLTQNGYNDPNISYADRIAKINAAKQQFGVNDQQIADSLSKSLGTPITPGNVNTYLSGAHDYFASTGTTGTGGTGGTNTGTGGTGGTGGVTPPPPPPAPTPAPTTQPTPAPGWVPAPPPGSTSTPPPPVPTLPPPPGPTPAPGPTTLPGTTGLIDAINIPGATQAATPAPVTAAPTPTAAPVTAGTATAGQTTAATWTPDAKSTVSGQIKDIIAENSPLMQQAATRGLQQANKRGLINSSMAVQAGQSALYDAALPIAQQDANTFAQAGAANAQRQQETGTFNATMATDVSKFNIGNMLQAGIINQDQANKMTQFASSEQNKMVMFQLQNDADIAKFNASESNALLKLGMDSQTKLALGQIEAAYKVMMQTSASSADVYKTLVAQMGEILANKDMDEGAKRAAVENLVSVLNGALGVIGSISNMNLPELDFSDLSVSTAAPSPAPAPAPVDGSGGSGWIGAGDSSGSSTGPGPSPGAGNSSPGNAM